MQSSSIACAAIIRHPWPATYAGAAFAAELPYAWLGPTAWNDHTLFPIEIVVMTLLAAPGAVAGIAAAYWE